MGLMAAAANAGTLSMRFAGDGNEVTMAPSDTVTIEIVFEMSATQDGPKTPSRLTGMDLRFEVGAIVPGVGQDYVANDSGLNKFVVTGSSADQSGWNNNSDPNGSFFNLGGFFYSVTDPSNTGILGTTLGPQVIGTITIHKAGPGPWPAADLGVVFRNGGALPGLYNIGANWGNRFGYTTEVARNQFLTGQGSSGDGNPALPYHGYETFEPLIIHCVPEPGSLALLALGGFAALRRRK
jgi:hypothetical protein